MENEENKKIVDITDYIKKSNKEGKHGVIFIFPNGTHAMKLDMDHGKSAREIWQENGGIIQQKDLPEIRENWQNYFSGKGCIVVQSVTVDPGSFVDSNYMFLPEKITLQQKSKLERIKTNEEKQPEFRLRLKRLDTKSQLLKIKDLIKQIEENEMIIQEEKNNIK